MIFTPTIGLEIHCQIKTNTKMFCSCSNDSNEKTPNINVCPICLGHPGSLPTANIKAIKKTIKLGIALNSKISPIAKFDRKNYFYPDLPKGYQISQYDMPFCKGGILKIKTDKNCNNLSDRENLVVSSARNKDKVIRINRVHLEEDTGSLIHEQKNSLINFNRAGIPLLELVTEPDMKSGKEAKKFAEELQLIFRYLDISEAHMEKGEMRIEANISIAPLIMSSKVTTLGTKVEIKNLNSLKALEEAILYETKRQTKILKRKEKIIQETRGWDEKQKKTISQRIKETAKDYRYFPEPDLPIFFIKTKKLKYEIDPPQKICPSCEIDVSEIKSLIPILPQQKKEIFIEKHYLSEEIAQILIEKQELGIFFEEILKELKKINHKEIDLSKEVCFPYGNKTIPSKLKQIIVNYLINNLQDLQKNLPKGTGLSREACSPHGISSENFAEFVLLIYKGTLSSKSAKIVFKHLFKTNERPLVIIERKNLLLITDDKKIESIIKQIIRDNPEIVKKYQRGQKQVFEFLVGQGIKESKNQIDPSLIRKKLIEFI